MSNLYFSINAQLIHVERQNIPKEIQTRNSKMELRKICKKKNEK